MTDVRVMSGSLEDDHDTQQVIIRGVLDQATLKFIGIAWYQRERGFSPNHIAEIVGAFFAGNKVADITIGMRGEHVRSKGDDYLLQDKCYCIDGGQRLYSAAMAIKERPDLKINLGCKVYTNTTEQFENDLFCKLGSTQVPISSSILIRNKRKTSRASALLWALSKQPEFALKDRIAWDQRKTRHELMSGYCLTRIAGVLHSHKVGGLRTARHQELLPALDMLVERIGEEAIAGNILRFFDGIDKCWTIRQLSGARNEARPHLQQPFLMTLAKLFSAYTDFWDGKERTEFYFLDKFAKRLKGFTLTDYVTPRSKVPLDALYEVLRKRLQLNPIFEQPVDEAAE